jgi:hypothetical protein
LRKGIVKAAGSIVKEAMGSEALGKAVEKESKKKSVNKDV